jgi:hypothetical protein
MLSDRSGSDAGAAGVELITTLPTANASDQRLLWRRQIEQPDVRVQPSGVVHSPNSYDRSLLKRLVQHPFCNFPEY